MTDQINFKVKILYKKVDSNNKILMKNKLTNIIFSYIGTSHNR
jgi:hypothetical protein